MDEEDIKSHFSYQKEMERSFAVIYHNLKRLQDVKLITRKRRHMHSEGTNPISSQQRESREPVGKKLHSESQASKKTNRRVSFAVDSSSP